MKAISNKLAIFQLPNMRCASSFSCKFGTIVQSVANLVEIPLSRHWKLINIAIEF